MQESIENKIFLLQGRLEGRVLGEIKLLIRLLNRHFGKLDTSISEKFRKLSFSQWEELEELIFDFSSVEDLNTWLNKKILK